MDRIAVDALGMPFYSSGHPRASCTQANQVDLGNPSPNKGVAMNPPQDTNLPFFSYGMFRPGELGFLRLKGLTNSVFDGCDCKGEIKIRDGLPILDPEGTRRAPGTIIRFKKDLAVKASGEIGELEPDNQYWWSTTEVRLGDRSQGTCNLLFGKSPGKGSKQMDIQ